MRTHRKAASNDYFQQRLKDTYETLETIKPRLLNEQLHKLAERNYREPELPVFRDEILRRCKKGNSFYEYKKDFYFIHRKENSQTAHEESAGKSQLQQLSKTVPQPRRDSPARQTGNQSLLVTKNSQLFTPEKRSPPKQEALSTINSSKKQYTDEMSCRSHSNNHVRAHSQKNPAEVARQLANQTISLPVPEQHQRARQQQQQQQNIFRKPQDPAQPNLTTTHRKDKKPSNQNNWNIFSPYIPKTYLFEFETDTIQLPAVLAGSQAHQNTGVQTKPSEKTFYKLESEGQKQSQDTPFNLSQCKSLTPVLSAQSR